MTNLLVQADSRFHIMNETTASTLESFRLRLTQQLQLNQLIPIDVARRAQQDSSYCYHLIAAQSNSLWLDLLFKIASEDHKHGKTVEDTNKGTGKVTARFGSSLARWGINGFKITPADVLDKRWKACQECPHLVQPPDKIIYHLGRRIISRGNDERICNLCGCFAYTKCSIATQSCPAPHPISKGLTRWGDPITKHKEKEPTYLKTSEGVSP